jgi:hypothetical protein
MHNATRYITTRWELAFARASQNPDTTFTMKGMCNNRGSNSRLAQHTKPIRSTESCVHPFEPAVDPAMVCVASWHMAAVHR